MAEIDHEKLQTHSADGVDLTLIRMCLQMSVSQRIDALEQMANLTLEARDRARTAKA